MSCEGLLNRLGYSCREVGERIIAVQTPFTFIDGEPINFYLDESGDSVVLHDNADTLAHLMGIGWDNSDRRGWRGIKNIIGAFGFELEESGMIVGRKPRQDEEGLIAKFVCAMLAVADYERDYFGLTEEQAQYIEEVELALRASRPGAAMILRPSVTGHSGRTHEFHFDFDDTYYDASKPHGGRTGSILRKAADVKNFGIEKKIVVVMDDREDTDRAKAETDILSTSVGVIQFSVLAAQAIGERVNH
jgi:hypothetical protein